ncbi:MAG TPA: 5'-nucleotidase C-terminal domain-containing protein, partial [Pseudomonadota bacterium]|nr:5'-nucleotidase C-terminal domain-containing protein [Pseudomonadota bacterium]
EDGLVELFRKNIQGSHGVLVPSGGFRIESRCDGSELKVDMFGPDGKPVDSDRIYAVAVSDFLALGGDNFGTIVPKLGQGSVQVFEDTMLREVIVGELQRYQGPFLSGSPQPHRLNLPMPRPVRCPPSNM